MDNKIKTYLDRVVIELVKDTEIDYEKKKISFLFFPSSKYNTRFSLFFSIPFPHSSSFFYSYCIDTFGLTEEEIDYVWKEYKSIILDKIK
jgi:hypothetical protein